jgi:hypothetical protein
VIGLATAGPPASAQDRLAGPSEVFTLHVTAACTPRDDLKVESCTIVACDIAPVPSIRDGALAYLTSSYRLPQDWKDKLVVDGGRVFIPFALTLRAKGPND